MAEKKVKNPFDFLSEKSATRHIKVKSLGSAEVEVKTALSVSDEQDIARTKFKNQESKDMAIVPNQADFALSKLQTVSLILVEPKMSMRELGDLVGGTKVIDEIYNEFHKYQNEQNEKNKGN